MNKYLKFSGSLIVASLLVGCGSSDSTVDTTAPATQTGTFVDAPVKGLRYITPTQDDFTDDNGSFKYKDGETVEFKLGNLSFGSVPAGSLITPYTMAGDTNISNPSDKAKNIAMLLQNFDGNRSNEGMLDLSKLKNFSFTDVNLTAPTATMETKINDLLTTGSFHEYVDTNRTLVTATIATNKMKEFVETAQSEKGLGILNQVEYAGNYTLTAQQYMDSKYSQLGFEVRNDGFKETIFDPFYFYFSDDTNNKHTQMEPNWDLITWNDAMNENNYYTSDAFFNYAKSNNIWEITSTDTDDNWKPTSQIALSSSNYRMKYPEEDGIIPNDECTILSSKKVTKIIGIPVDAIEVREFCKYGNGDDFGVGEEWEDSGYGTNYKTYYNGQEMTKFTEHMMDGFGGKNVKLTADHKLAFTDSGKIIANSSWELIDGILKVKYWDEVWFKLGDDGYIQAKYIGDESVNYLGITKTQAQAITNALGLPTWNY